MFGEWSTTVFLRRILEGDVGLPDEMHGKDHTGVQYRDITVVAFERRHGSPIGVRDRVQGFAALHLVVYDDRRFCGLFPFDLRRLRRGRFYRGRLGSLGTAARVLGFGGMR